MCRRQTASRQGPIRQWYSVFFLSMITEYGTGRRYEEGHREETQVGQDALEGCTDLQGCSDCIMGSCPMVCSLANFTLILTI
jgi:hypothetical protein